MELKNNKSTWAALATLGIGAVAAGLPQSSKYARNDADNAKKQRKTKLTVSLLLTRKWFITKPSGLSCR